MWKREHRGSTRKTAAGYHKTINGYLSGTYKNMRRLVKGATDKTASYKGLPLLSKDHFYTWSRRDNDFLYLFKQWIKYGCDGRLSPSVNRIDPALGFTISNIEWLTKSSNSSLGGKNKGSAKQAYQAIERIYKDVKAT